MNQSFSDRLKIVTLLLGCCLAVSGCALPGRAGSAARPAQTDRLAATNMPAGDRATANPVVPPSDQATAAPIHTTIPLAAGGPPEGAVSQVGHLVPAQLAGNCRCGLCKPDRCGPCCESPGYVMMSPQGWNAYGIDPQEFLCDGGDYPPRAILTKNESLAGLNPEDTVVHYTTEAGNIHIQESNRACLYAPRFTSVRKITGAVAGGRAIGLRGLDRPVGPDRFEHDLPGLVMTDATELAHADVARRIDAMRDRNRGVPVEGILQPEQAADVMAALAALKWYDLRELKADQLALIQRLALAAVPWTIDESLEVAVADLLPPTLTRDEHVEAFTIYEFPDAGRLRIVKMADRGDALPGELVTFMIRIDNVGDSSVNHVVLTDNLTTRLEYVEGSQTVDGSEAEFSAVSNEEQSSRLQWKLSKELEVGESVTIKFQCKVR